MGTANRAKRGAVVVVLLTGFLTVSVCAVRRDPQRAAPSIDTVGALPTKAAAHPAEAPDVAASAEKLAPTIAPSAPPPDVRPTAATAPSGVRSKASDAQAPARLGRESAIRSLGEHLPLLRECYEALLERLPDMGGGEVFVNLTIDADPTVGGVVSDVALEGGGIAKDEGFARCLEETLLTVAFAAPETMGQATLAFPLRFAPHDDGTALPE